jgi:hypothetical protein
MKKLIYLLFFGSFFLFSACEDAEDDGMSMQFVETKCDNPWDIEPGPENYIVEVRKYLEVNEIKVLSIFIEVYDETAGENCNTCDCPTGRSIVIGLPPADVDDAKAIGFTIIE